MKELLNKNEEQLQETVLITGATGFLGEYLVRRLIKKYRVRRKAFFMDGRSIKASTGPVRFAMAICTAPGALPLR